MDSKPSVLNNAFIFVIVLLMAIIWFSMLGHRDLIEPDEGRYAEIPREMVASGDWVTPRLNDFKYFEKPAFQYWMTAISYKLFGQTNATARLWTASFGFFCALFVGYIGSVLFGRESGFYAFIVTASSLLFVGLGHILTLDMTVSVFLVMSMGAFVAAQHHQYSPRQVLCWMMLSWASIAGAVLSKGLIGVVLPAGTLVIYTLWQRDWTLWGKIHLLKGIVLLLVLTVPWFYFVCQKNDEFFDFFFIHEHWDRYTTTEHSREGPIYYFILVFVVGMVPWLGTAVSSVFKPDFNWRPDERGGFNAEKFLWVFCVLTFSFFSLGKSKLPAYILPIVPILGILIGNRLHQQISLKTNAWLTFVFAALLMIVGLFISRLANEKYPVELYLDYQPWILCSSVLLFLSGGALFVSSKSKKGTVVFAGLAALLSFQLIGWGFQSIAESRSSRSIAEAIVENQLSDRVVYSVEGSYPQSLPFYLNKTIVLTGYKGELTMGIDAEPEKWVESSDQFIDLWSEETQAVAVFKRNGYEKFKELGIPMRLIYDGPRRVAVAKH